MYGTLSLYVPMDRRQALARGQTLPDRAEGAALFADISGFTALTEALARELGPQRGAEELTLHLSRVYDALICELDKYGGSVIGFAGDAITCWLDRDNGLRATACALDMRRAMERFSSVAIPSGDTVSLGMKVAVAAGSGRRFLIGDPALQVRDVLAGSVLDRLAAAEHEARRGEVVIDADTAGQLAPHVTFREWRANGDSGQHVAVVDSLRTPVRPTPWPVLSPDALDDRLIRPFLLRPVFERLAAGQGDFLAELRPAVALFLQFGGIDYDQDPDAAERLDAFIRRVQTILARYEGNLIQLTMGDKGSYAYAAFGAPQAHEDDVVRAVSAADELRSAGEGLVSGVKAGLAQGVMRTGAYGGQTRRTYDVLGDAANLAARLMQAAAPGQVLAPRLLAESTTQDFDWETLPDIEVKGKQASVSVCSLVGGKTRSGGALDVTAELPMVGREAELKTIAERLDLTLAGHGQVIGITAEAGMGKSRLVSEASRLARERGVTVLWGQCESFGTNTSYLAWQTIWRSFFELDAVLPSIVGNAAGSEIVLRELEKRLDAIDPLLVQRAPLLGAVLNIPLPDNELTRSFDAKLRKSSLESLLADCLRARAGATPLVLVLDESHWIDPLSHDLLEIAGRLAARLPVLIVTAYRPLELRQVAGTGETQGALRISRLPNFTEIRLTGFTPEQAEKLIALKLEQFFGSRFEVPADLVQRIMTRAEGNPFYIAELLNYLKDRGIDPHDAAALAQLDLPASLHRLILARVDQLTDSQRTTLRVASVVGRQFRAASLWGACPQCGEPERIMDDLNALSRLELTLLEDDPGLIYLFKHIITQEVAYESLSFALRSMLHNQIGEFLEQEYSAELEQHLDLLAFHFDRTENYPKRREYLQRAAESAQHNYANAAAIDYYQRVLPLLTDPERVDSLLRLGQVLELTGKWTEAADEYQRALRLASRLEDGRGQARCEAALGELQRKQGAYEDAVNWLELARIGFEALDDTAGVGQVLHVEGSVAAQQGDYVRARALYGRSLSVRRLLGDRPQIANSLNNLGIVARSVGEVETARQLYEESLAIRRDLNDRRAIAVSLNNLGNLARHQGQLDEARARLEEAIALQREVGDRHYLANALNNLGNVARDQGDHESAQELYAESLTINRELGDAWQLAYLIEDIGVLAVLQARYERALLLIGAATGLRETIGAPRSPAEQIALDSSLAPALAALSEATREGALHRGREMPLDLALDHAGEFVIAGA